MFRLVLIFCSTHRVFCSVVHVDQRKIRSPDLPQETRSSCVLLLRFGRCCSQHDLFSHRPDPRLTLYSQQLTRYAAPIQYAARLQPGQSSKATYIRLKCHCRSTLVRLDLKSCLIDEAIESDLGWVLQATVPAEYLPSLLCSCICVSR